MQLTEVFVPGRAHAAGTLELSQPSIARVETAVEYYLSHEELFDRKGGQIHFEGGWAAGAAGMAKPPEDKREGSLMYDMAADLGVPEKFRSKGIESTTTMSNWLDVKDKYGCVGRLAVVTQMTQAARHQYCAQKVLPGTSLMFIKAPGETDPAIEADEERLLKQSHILYGWARGPRMLRVADRMGIVAGRLAGVRPADKYTA